MKTLTCCIVTTALFAGVAVELKPTASIQANQPQPNYVLKSIPFSAVHHAQTGGPRLRLWEGTSGNWSGYAVPLEGSGASDIFSSVAGTWNIPTVTGPKRTTTYSSVWVGIDGYTSGTVEQIGTEQDWTGAKQQNYVWFEMYPSGAYQITGFPANPGDSISAQVTYAGTTTIQTGNGRNRKTVTASVFNLTIVNNTKNVSYTVPSSYTTTTAAVQSSAEWIVEAPSSGRILPLAKFSTVNFSNCSATGLLGTGSITNWPSDPLTMVDPSGGTATPSSLSSDGTAFSVQSQ